LSRKKERTELKNAVEDILESEGPLLQGDLKSKIWEEYPGIYSSKQSLAVTLSQVRQKWEQTGFISTEEAEPSRGSIMTHRWRLEK
jgi:hypothetical protein